MDNYQVYPKKHCQQQLPKEQPNEVAADTVHIGPSVILHCKQWEDFQNLAVKAQTLSFSYKEEEKIFQADALKGNQFITYSGALPKLSVYFEDVVV